jgi:hypothetical protein
LKDPLILKNEITAVVIVIRKSGGVTLKNTYPRAIKNEIGSTKVLM